MKKDEVPASTENIDLFQMIKKVYSMKSPVSRLLYIGKIRENEKLSRQALNDMMISETSKILQEVKSCIEENQVEDFISYLIVFLGSNLGNFCIVLIEVNSLI